MSAGQDPNFVADGDINPSRFVTMNGVSGDNRVAQCGANQKAVGIAQEWTRAVPTPSNSTLAAISGDSLTVYGIGKQCLLEYGATVVRGQQLKSDSVGRGVPIVGTTAQNAGAMALESGSSGELHRVLVRPDVQAAPAS